MSKAILVLGMHRSGTSALAGALARLGVELGDRLMDGAAGDNPKGFFEHLDVVAAHDEIALRHGRTWDDPRPASPELHDQQTRAALTERIDDIITRDFDGASLWAVKDPRLCRFLPIWLEALDRRGIEAHCLVILRSPAEVAASLARRDGFSADKSAALWIDHVLGALRDAAGRPRARLSFDNLLADPPATLSRCAAELGLSWPEPAEGHAGELQEFLRPARRPPSGGGESFPEGSRPRLAEEIWSGLQATTDWPSSDQLVAWDRALVDSSRDLSPLVLEHATQLAERGARQRSWESERRLRAEVEEQLTGMERRIAETLGKLAEEVAGHAGELTRHGELIRDLRDQLHELDQRVQAVEHQLHQLERIDHLERCIQRVETRLGELTHRSLGAKIHRARTRLRGEDP